MINTAKILRQWILQYKNACINVTFTRYTVIIWSFKEICISTSRPNMLFYLLRCLKILKNEFVKDLSKRYSKVFDMEV